MKFKVYEQRFEITRLIVGEQKFPGKNITDDCMPCIWVGTPVADYEPDIICVSDEYWADANVVSAPHTLSWVYELCGGKEKIKEILTKIYEENKNNKPHHIPPYGEGE